MTLVERPARAFIHPPPLPEFYSSARGQGGPASSSHSSNATGDEHALMSREKHVQILDSSTTSTDESAASCSIDGSCDEKEPSWMSRPFAHPTVALPPPYTGSGAPGEQVPPLAIYHICRICLRPRSHRFHREHPIPLDGLPPPPGICRRCRVIPVEDVTTVDEVVIEGESREVKLGCFTPFMSETHIISNEAAKKMHVDRWLGGRDQDREVYVKSNASPQREWVLRRSSKPEVAYRHVRLIDEPQEPVQPRTSFVTDTARKTPEYVQPGPEHSYTARTTRTSLQVQPTEHPPSLPSTTTEEFTLGGTKIIRASATSQKATGSDQSKQRGEPVYPEPTSSRRARTDSAIGRVTEQDNGKRDSKRDSKYSGTNELYDDLRGMVREEVRRYRQAERKLETHPAAYSHGRMASIVREIEVERKIVRPIPKSDFDRPPIKDPVPPQTASERKKSQNVETALPNKTTEHQTKMNETSRRAIRDVEGGSHMYGSFVAPRHNRGTTFEYQQVEGGIEQERPGFVSQKRSSKEGDQAGRIESRQRSRADNDCNDVKSSSAARQSSRPKSHVVEVIIERQPKSRAGPGKVHLREDTASNRTPTTQPEANVKIGSSKSDAARRTQREQIDRPRGRVPVSGSHKQNQPSPNDCDWHNNGDGRESQQESERKVWRRHESIPAYSPDSHSSRQRHTSGSGGTRKSDVTAHRYTRRDLPPESSRVLPSARRSDQTVWQSDRPTQATTTTTETKGDRPTRDRDDREHTETPLAGGSRTRFAEAQDFTADVHPAWERRVRTVQPADRPYGMDPFDDAPPAHVDISDRLEIDQYYTHDTSQQQIGSPSENNRSAVRSGRERHERNTTAGDYSNRVKFSTHIDISPTPPGSDADSADFRSYHSLERKVDQEDNIRSHRDRNDNASSVQYERRSRTRSRNQRQGDDRTSAGQAEDLSASQTDLRRALSESPSREESLCQAATAGSAGTRRSRDADPDAGPMDEGGSGRMRSWKEDGPASPRRDQWW